MVNKVVYGGETLLDLTGDSVTPETLLAGATAHNAAGKQIEGAVDLSAKQDKITASGILKGDGAGGVSAAAAGTDYIAPAAKLATATKYLRTKADGTVEGVDLPNAGTGTRGITYLVNSYTRTDTDKAATAKALNDVSKLLPGGNVKSQTLVSTATTPTTNYAINWQYG